MNTEYDVVMSVNLSDFKAMVQSFLAQGWVLAGGVAVAPDGYGRDMFYQAIYRSCL